MVQGKYLSEEGVIDIDDIQWCHINLIQSDCGSGKTNFIFNKLLKWENINRCIYLIDTTIGRDQKVKEFLEAKQWTPNLNAVIDNCGENIFLEEDNKIFVMTYAKFGLLCRANPNFSSYFDLIIADEFHNCLKYVDIDKARVKKQNPSLNTALSSKDRLTKKNAYDKLNTILSLTSNTYAALHAIEMIAMGMWYDGQYWCPCREEKRVLAITATPKIIYDRMEWLVNDIEASCQTIAYETLQTIEYSSIFNVINNLKKEKEELYLLKKYRV